MPDQLQDQDQGAAPFQYEDLWQRLVQRLHTAKIDKGDLDKAVAYATHGQAKSFHDLAQMRMTNQSLASQQASVQPTPPPNPAEAALGGAAQGATLNFAPRIGAAMQAIGGEQPYEPAKKGLEDRLAAGHAAHPLFQLLGALGGGAAGPGGYMLPPGEAQLGPALAKGTGAGAVVGGVASAGAQPDLTNLDPAQLAKGVGLGGLAGFGGTAIARGAQARSNPGPLALARAEENIPMGTTKMAGGEVPGALSADVPRKLPIVNEEVRAVARSAARVPVAGRVMANNIQNELKRVTGVINGINEGYTDLADATIADPRAAQLLREHGVSSVTNPVKPTFANLNRLRQELRDDAQSGLNKGGIKSSDAAKMIAASTEIDDMLRKDPNVGAQYADLQARSAPWQQYRSELNESGRQIGMRIQYGRVVLRGRRLFLQNPQFSIDEGLKELGGLSRYQVTRRSAQTVAQAATKAPVNPSEYQALLQSLRLGSTRAAGGITAGALAGAQSAAPNLMGEPEGPNDQ